MTTTADGAATYSVSLQVLVAMTVLTVLPALLLTMTSFTRIIIVLAILRQALGTMQTPPNQVLIGLALFLTLFVMSPVLQRINQEAVQPYLTQQMPMEEALEHASTPMRQFMTPLTREQDLTLFAGLAGADDLQSPDEVPFSLLVPAFLTSELKTAFQMGFLIFLPFLVIDIVVAAVLMSMGMMMLSPMIISLPFKLMLFVLIDGWTLIMGTLANSFL
jgi:flagellar biosynthetic protein FliP